MLSTNTLNKFPELTFDDLLEAHRSFLKKFGGFKSSIKCSPEAYIAIKDVCLAYEEDMEEHKWIKAENMKRRGETYEEPKNWGSIFGVEIILDPDLRPGEWKFE